MRKLIVSTFTSLDGVMQAPGGPNEDPSGGFSYGGWVFAYGDPEMDISEAGFDGVNRDILLGRKTYEIFEAYWPYQSDDNPVAKSLNAAKKYVASLTRKSLEWNNSTLLGADTVQAVTALKAEHGPDIQVIGSGDLVQTLHRAALIDEYNIWSYPIVLGQGKRLFENSAKPAALHLVRSRVSKSGVLMNTYVPAGDIRIELDMPDRPSAKELRRREKMTLKAGE